MLDSRGLQDQITGTEFNYYYICYRKLWLFSHGIQMEQESDDVLLGKLIDENSYPRQKREILINGIIKIGFMEKDAVHEVKKSDKMEDANIGQVLYYIYCLRQKGKDIRKGVINYPTPKRTTEVEIIPEKEQQIENVIKKVKRIEAMDTPPNLLNSRLCRRCRYGFNRTNMELL